MPYLTADCRKAIANMSRTNFIGEMLCVALTLCFLVLAITTNPIAFFFVAGGYVMYTFIHRHNNICEAEYILRCIDYSREFPDDDYTGYCIERLRTVGR